ncbi:MAG: hypothetical protein AAFR90_14990, partial [Pseudomonadota bacterium]
MLAWLWTKLSESSSQAFISGRVLRRISERDLDRLLRTRVLIEQRKYDSWSVCSDCCCGLDARPIRQIGGKLYACCPHDKAEDFALEKQDIRRFVISPTSLCKQIALSGGLSCEIAQVTDDLWLIGTSPLGVVILLCKNTKILGVPGTILAIKEVAQHRPIVILASKFTSDQIIHVKEAGLDGKPISECLVSTDTGQEHLIVDQNIPASDAPRLVLNKGEQMVILDNCRLDLSPQMFALFQLLVEQAQKR